MARKGPAAFVEPRKALLFALVMVMPAFAGCNVKDWYNQEGWVAIDLALEGGRNSTIDHFRSVKAAVYGVSLRQAGTTDAKHFTFGADPLIVDLVEKAKEGETVRLAEFKTNLRATERVAVRITVFEAIDAAGNSMEICRLDDTPERFPCFYQPDNAALLYEEKSFSPPRGGRITVGFPVAIQFAQQGRASEYFLYADPGKVTLDVER